MFVASQGSQSLYTTFGFYGYNFFTWKCPRGHVGRDAYSDNSVTVTVLAVPEGVTLNSVTVSGNICSIVYRVVVVKR